MFDKKMYPRYWTVISTIQCNDFRLETNKYLTEHFDVILIWIQWVSYSMKAAHRESTTFCSLWWRISLSIREQTTLNHVLFVIGPFCRHGSHFDLYCFKIHYGLLYRECRGKFLLFSRSERTLSDSKSTVEDKKKILWAHDQRTSFPCHQIGTEFVLVCWLDIMFEGVTDWTNRKAGSQKLLRQAAWLRPEKKKPNCFDGPCAASVPSRTMTALTTWKDPF